MPKIKDVPMVMDSQVIGVGKYIRTVTRRPKVFTSMGYQYDSIRYGAPLLAPSAHQELRKITAVHTY